MDESSEAIAILVDQLTAIKNSMHDDDPIAVFEETDILLKTLADDFKKEHDLEGLEKDIEALLNKQEYNRTIRLNSIIKQDLETHIEYLDQDRGNDERLNYKTPLEAKIIKMYSKIRKLLATIIKTKLNDDITLN